MASDSSSPIDPLNGAHSSEGNAAAAQAASNSASGDPHSSSSSASSSGGGATSEQQSSSGSQSTGPLATGPLGGLGIQLDLKKYWDLTIQVVTNPQGVWPAVKAEHMSVADIYSKMAIPLTAIPAISIFIGLHLLGPLPVFSGLFFGLMSYFMGLAILYILAQVLVSLAPSFGGSTTIENALKLILVSLLPMFFASILFIVPLGLILFLVPLIAIFVGLYAFYQGIPEMTAVPDAKRVPYFCVYVVCAIGVGVLRQTIFGV